MNPRDGSIQANGIRLHYLDYSGSDTTLVLLHGLTTNGHAFDGLVQAGLSPRFRVVAPDLRGRGASDQPPAGYTMPDHAADVIALLDALKLERVALGGHSFGGFLSMYIAAFYPERVSRLVVLDAGFAMASTRTRDQIKPSLDRLGHVSPSWESYLAAIKQAPYYAGWWDPAIEDYYRADVRTNPDGSVQPRSRPATIEGAMEGLLAEPWADHAALIRQPVLLVHALGPYGPPGAPPILAMDAARETVAAIYDCRYVQVPGNHMTMLYGAGAREAAGAIAAFVATEARGTGDGI